MACDCGLTFVLVVLFVGFAVFCVVGLLVLSFVFRFARFSFGLMVGLLISGFACFGFVYSSVSDGLVLVGLVWLLVVCLLGVGAYLGLDFVMSCFT